jgi:signal transduction histidine kinase
MNSVANELELRITDFGIGISPALQKQLFEKYFRVEETSVRFQGLGIGLFICSEIIQRHSGYCDVESEVGKGSTFYFKIPLRPPQISEENKPIKSNL